MEMTIKLGLRGNAQVIVDGGNTAKHHGSGRLDVFATPAMVALMEQAALLAVEELLPEGYDTVGIRIQTTHIAATPMGMTVRAEAELTQVEGKKLTFMIKAYDEKEMIGEAIHERVIIQVDRFLQKAEDKRISEKK
jgi:fluoroacetyl-CoA thioesterase